MTLDTKTLRRMWSCVETSNPYTTIKLSDDEIVQRLIEQAESISPLNSEDSDVLTKYISARISLIRDLAHAKVT